MSTESEPSAAEGEWVFHDGEGPYAGWLFRYADGTLVTADGTVLEEATSDVAAPAEPVAEPDPEPDPVPEPDPEPEPDPQPDPEPEPEPEPEHPGAPPEFLRWSTSAVPQVLSAVIGVAAAIGAVIMLVTSLGDGTDGWVTAVGLALLAAAGLYGLTALAPSTVTLRGSVLSIDHGGEETTYDLADAGTSVDLTEPGEGRWSARLSKPGGRATVLRSSHVDPTDFTAACRAHLARRKGEHED